MGRGMLYMVGKIFDKWVRFHIVHNKLAKEHFINLDFFPHKVQKNTINIFKAEIVVDETVSSYTQISVKYKPSNSYC